MAMPVMKTDLSGKYCGNTTKKYRGSPCRYYGETDGQCALLLANKTSEFWEKCRLDNFALLYKLVNINFKNFRIKNPFLHVDEAEDFDFKGVVDRLKAVELKSGFNLPVRVSIMKKTVFREVRDNLYNRGLLPRVKKCGSCRHLSGTAPFICALNGEYRKKSDTPCDDYVKISPIIQSITVNSGNGTKPMTHGYFSVSPSLCNNILDRDSIGRITVIELLDILCQRAEFAENGSKKRKMRKRQYDIFINIIHTVSEGVSVEKAVNNMTTDYNITRKTILRDLKDMRLFFKKNVL